MIKKTRNRLFIVLAISLSVNLISAGLFVYSQQKKIVQTEIVFAEIIDAGIRTPGGLGAKSKVGYIRFRYFNNGKEVIRSTESFEIRDNIEQYRIGYCIELLIS